MHDVTPGGRHAAVSPQSSMAATRASEHTGEPGEEEEGSKGFTAQPDTTTPLDTTPCGYDQADTPDTEEADTADTPRIEDT